MTDTVKLERGWRDDELDAIVADYFDMLAAELGKKPYSKAEHNEALGRLIGRGHGAIEFKHQNISAVLEELGMPWIFGYKPRRNYQNAIFDAIDRYLHARPHLPESIPTVHSTATPDVFVPTPVLMSSDDRPERLRHLIRKYDPVERDYRNRALGQAGEAFVLDVERCVLKRARRQDLAQKIRWIAAEEGDGAGYDVLSFAADTGRERLIEVKTTNGSAQTPFYLSRNERSLSEERPDAWCIYRVHFFASKPRIFSLSPPLEGVVHLSPESWRAFF